MKFKFLTGPLAGDDKLITEGGTFSVGEVIQHRYMTSGGWREQPYKIVSADLYTVKLEWVEPAKPQELPPILEDISTVKAGDE